MLSFNSMFVVVTVLSLSFSAKGLRLAEDTAPDPVASNPVTDHSLDDIDTYYKDNSTAAGDIAPPEALPYKKIMEKMFFTKCQNESFAKAMLKFQGENGTPLGGMQNYMEAQVRYFNRGPGLSFSLPPKPTEKDDPACAEYNHKCMAKFTEGCKKDSKTGQPIPGKCCNPIQGSCVCMHNAACIVGVGKCPQLEYNDIKADKVIQYQTQFAYWIIFKTMYVEIMSHCDGCQEDWETKYWKPNNQAFGQKCGPCCTDEAAAKINTTCENQTLDASKCIDDDLIHKVYPHSNKTVDGNPLTF